jgi:hypothetical protein
MAVAKSLEIIAMSESTLGRVRERFPTYLADFRENPRWLLMFMFARTSLGRGSQWQGVADGQASKQPVPSVSPVPSMFDVSDETIGQALKHDGLFTGLQLPPATVAEIQTFARDTPCFGNHDRRLELRPADQISRQDSANPVLSGHYFERVADCPAIMAVQQDQLLHSVARNYLGERSCVISTRLWWSFPAGAAMAQQPQLRAREMLHFDLDDWRMLKFFFYLTPVSENAGPHLYVRGTHRRHVLKHQLSLTVGRPADEVLEAYGAERMVRIHGEAGFGFAEDPFGFHAGSLAISTPRLMLEVAFGVTPPNRRRFYGERVLK